MSIEQNNHGKEGAVNLSSQTHSNIRLLGKDTCKTSPYFRVVLDIATTYNLIGPVVTEHEGQTLVFDFYNPKDGSLYKVFTSTDFDEEFQIQDYQRYTDFPGDVSIIADVDNCNLNVGSCGCCGGVLVTLPYAEYQFSLKDDRTWVLCQGRLCEYERLNHEWYEVWHSVEPLRTYSEASAITRNSASVELPDRSELIPRQVGNN